MPRVFHTPGVYRSEIDLSEILVPNGISNGGIVINAPMGPVNRPVLITNDQEFVNTFGKPYFVSGASPTGIGGVPLQGFYPEYGYGSYAALEFLKESSVLYVVRNINVGFDYYASIDVKSTLNLGVATISASTSGMYIPVGISASPTITPDKVDRIQNLDSYNVVNNISVAALYPGLNGNNLAVTIEPISMSADWLYNYDNYVASASAVTQFPIASQVFKLNVYDNGGNNWLNFATLSGDSTSNPQRLRVTPVETFYGTLTPMQDGNKNQLFIESTINGTSKYIYVSVNNSPNLFSTITDYNNLPVKSDTNGTYVDFLRLMELSGGNVKAPANAGLVADQVASWSLFQDRENANVGILIAPTFNVAVKQEVARIAAKRMDCIAVLQTADPTMETVQQVIASEAYGYSNPSYVALYCGWSKTYDKYNDRFLYLPNAIYGAEIMARVDNIANPWDAPAGTTRATLQVFDQRRIWTFDEIGQLYDRNINSVRFIPGTGFVIWGQKTAQQKKSALDRINVRRDLLYIENNIESNLVQFVFENNTIKERSRVFALLDPFLQQVRSAGGLVDYKLVVDETNNTADVIDANQMNVDIYVQPPKAAEYINMRTVITRSGVSFEQVTLA